VGLAGKEEIDAGSTAQAHDILAVRLLREFNTSPASSAQEQDMTWLSLTTYIIAVAMVSTPALGATKSEQLDFWSRTVFEDESEVAKLDPKSCAIILDDCQACALKPDGTVNCSTPGFACVPTKWTCAKFTPDPQ
jgi:hypothetical protein